MIRRLLGLLSAGLLIACSGSSRLPSILLKEHGTVRDATTPPAGMLAEVQGLTRDGNTVRASWTVPSPQPWVEYLSWVTPRLGARGYMLVKTDTGSRVFSKRLPGYRLSVTLHAGVNGSFAVAFIAMPD